MRAATWFALDENNVPPLRKLRPASQAGEGQWWGAIFPALQRSLRAASLLASNLAEDRRALYSISVTHEEVIRGLLGRPEGERRGRTFVFFKSFGAEGREVKSVGDLKRKSYFDMAGEALDNDAYARLQSLKEQVRAAVPAENLVEGELEWVEGGMDCKYGPHSDWLGAFAREFQRKLCQSIDRAVEAKMSAGRGQLATFATARYDSKSNVFFLCCVKLGAAWLDLGWSLAPFCICRFVAPGWRPWPTCCWQRPRPRA